MMPNYFGFLTVMALYVFLHEGVDVALLEVGLGGQYDSTNLCRYKYINIVVLVWTIQSIFIYTNCGKFCFVLEFVEH